MERDGTPAPSGGPNQNEGPDVAAKILRAIVFLAGAVGLLALLGEPALAFVPHQHCEPMVRR